MPGTDAPTWRGGPVVCPGCAQAGVPTYDVNNQEWKIPGHDHPTGRRCRGSKSPVIV